jgi:hypothetical protein
VDVTIVEESRRPDNDTLTLPRSAASGNEDEQSGRRESIQPVKGGRREASQRSTGTLDEQLAPQPVVV